MEMEGGAGFFSEGGRGAGTGLVFPLGRGEFPGMCHLSTVEFKVRFEGKQETGGRASKAGKQCAWSSSILRSFPDSDPAGSVKYPERRPRSELPVKAQEMHSRKVWKQKTTNLKF